MRADGIETRWSARNEGTLPGHEAIAFPCLVRDAQNFIITPRVGWETQISLLHHQGDSFQNR